MTLTLDVVYALKLILQLGIHGFMIWGEIYHLIHLKVVKISNFWRELRDLCLKKADLLYFYQHMNKAL